jgi:hypothetical protein
MRRHDPVVGSNNGLALTADFLEAVYTQPDFPPRTLTLKPSLKDRGRTRADLWAFAALVAADFAMDENNNACKGESWCPHLYNEVKPSFPCEINATRSLRFYTGRRDCPDSTKPHPVNGFVKTEAFELPEGHRYRDYETTKDEDHPNPSGNSMMLTDYMKRVFDFSKKETVAIMGAHSLGKMHSDITLFKYQWQLNQNDYLNNNYYRLLANLPSKSIQSCSPFMAPGGANGSLATSTWVVRPFRRAKSGGPYIWFNKYRRCPACYKDDKGNWVNKELRGSKQYKSAECCVCHEKPESEIPDECIQAHTRDETMLPTDVALISKFDVDEHGVPGGCPGFPGSWNRKNILEQATGAASHGIKFQNTEPRCHDNDLRDSPDSMSMADQVRDYATDQNKWARDFHDAYEKMLSTGSPGLRLGPDVLGVGRADCPLTGHHRAGVPCSLRW